MPFILTVKDDKRIEKKVTRVNIQERATLKCQSHSKPIWFAKNQDSQPVEVGYVLTIKFSKLIHNGFYYCLGYYRGGKTFLAKAELKVYGKSF